MKLRDIGELILHFFFPNRCAFCGEIISYNGDVCSDCRMTAPRTDLSVCLICGMKECGCADNAFDVFAAPFFYLGGAAAAVKDMKFNGCKINARRLAAFMYPCLAEKSVTADVITAVPRFKGDRREDGDKHGEWLAAELSKLTGIPFERDLLIKTRKTAKQHKLDEAGRKTNVKNAFAASDIKVGGKRILLVDDVLTTGSTINECAKALKKAGAEYVAAVTAAKAKKR